VTVCGFGNNAKRQIYKQVQGKKKREKKMEMKKYNCTFLK